HSRFFPCCCQGAWQRWSEKFVVTNRPPCWVYGPLPALSNVALYRLSSSTSRISHSPLKSVEEAAVKTGRCSDGRSLSEMAPPALRNDSCQESRTHRPFRRSSTPVSRRGSSARWDSLPCMTVRM